jgi:hypothetical protein
MSGFVLDSEGKCGCDVTRGCGVCRTDHQTCDSCSSTGYTYLYALTDYGHCGCNGIANCQTCNLDDITCSACSPDYILDAAHKACGCYQFPKCIACDASKTLHECTTCEASYKLNEAKNACGCSAIDHCSICDTSAVPNKCATCESLYAPDETKAHCGCNTIANCQICDTTKDPHECPTCATDYIPDSTHKHCGCHLFTQCTYCNLAGDKCATCAGDYLPNTDGTCQLAHRYYTTSNFVSFAFDNSVQNIILEVNAAIKTISADCSLYFLSLSTLGASPSCSLDSTSKILTIKLGTGFTIKGEDTLDISDQFEMQSGTLFLTFTSATVKVTGGDINVYAVVSGPKSITLIF